MKSRYEKRCNHPSAYVGTGSIKKTISMKLTQKLSALMIVVAFVIAGCSKPGTGTDDNNNPPVTPPVVTTYPKPKTAQEMSDMLATAIKALTPTIYFDVSAMNLPDNQVEITAANAFSSVLFKDSSLKYAYRLVSIYNQAAKVLQCEIFPVIPEYAFAVPIIAPLIPLIEI